MTYRVTAARFFIGKFMELVQFKINKKHLAYQQWLKYLSSPCNAPEKWIALKQKLHNKYGEDIAFTLFTPGSVGYSLNMVRVSNGGEVKLKNPDKIDLIFDEIFSSKEFVSLYSETENYRTQLQSEWQDQGEKAMKLLRKITRLPIGDKEVEVFVLHPDIQNGSYLGDNLIEWGFPSIYKNSNVIGICHEILHSYTELQASNDMHVLIFLATQEELRCRINRGDKYFLIGNVNTSHSKLEKIERKLLPVWREYTQSNDSRTIIDLYYQITSKGGDT